MPDRRPSAWPESLPRSIPIPARSVAQNLVLTAGRHPDRPAIHYHGATLTFAELLAQVETLAGWLGAQGVAPGDRVLLYLQNSPQFVIAYYAILRADAVVVPVNPMNRTAELRHMAVDVGARAIVVGQERLAEVAPLLADGTLAVALAAAYADMADPACDIPLPEGLRDPAPAAYDTPGVTPWARAMATDARPGPIAAGPDDLAVIPYSSGTTGAPKGCMHSHRTVMTTLVGGIEWNPRGLGHATLATLPLFHVTGMQNSMNGPIYSGEPIVIMTRWDRRIAAELIRRHRVARWRSISTMAIDLVNDPDLGTYDLSSLQAIGGGGASMPEAVARRLKAATGLDYIEGYGMSETMAATHINPVDRPRRHCLGIPVFDVDARIIDPGTLAELPTGEVGEIVVDAPQNFLGYWNDPDATAAAFLEIDGRPFLRTGDIGLVDAEGYFFITDRLKRMVNVAGFKVWPTEVENMIHDHPDVAEVCIVAARDARKGEAVLAYVVARGALTAEALIAWCRERMATYKCPAQVVFLDALPRSPSGKVLWMDLEARARQDG